MTPDTPADGEALAEAIAQLRGKMHDIMCLPDDASVSVAKRWALEAHGLLSGHLIPRPAEPAQAAQVDDGLTPERRRLNAWSAGHPRSELALVAIAAWCNTTPDKLPPDFHFHTCEATQKAWGRVVDAIIAAAQEGRE